MTSTIKIVGASKGKNSKGKANKAAPVTALSAMTDDQKIAIVDALPVVTTTETEQADGTIVVTVGEETPVVGEAPQEETATNDALVTEAPQAAPSQAEILKAWMAPTTVVTVVLPKGTRETSRWFVCPEGKNGHRASFDKTKIVGFTSHTTVTETGADDSWEYGGNRGVGATVTAPRAVFSYRKMAHLIPATPPAPVADDVAPQAE